MLLRLAEHLDIPLRQRNSLLLAGGHAPVYRERGLDEAELASVRETVDRLLRAHEPFPALAVDRHWTMLAANRGVALLLEDVDATLLQPPVNALRLSLHPRGLAPRIRNLGEWRAHVLARLQHQHRATADPVLGALMDELSCYPAPGGGPVPAAGDVVVPLRLATSHGELALISTTTVFGTPLDITISELALETFFPADAASAAILALHAASFEGTPAEPAGS